MRAPQDPPGYAPEFDRHSMFTFFIPSRKKLSCSCKGQFWHDDSASFHFESFVSGRSDSCTYQRSTAMLRLVNYDPQFNLLAQQSEILTDFQRKVMILFKPFREFYAGLEMSSDSKNPFDFSS